ncbi:protein kinase domain-containing protein [Legionella fairfieldensis]|uniref:protein kinase domain-containing protein n=1 Tax=Legionella fairfieldensis TaxID=45064 RepID=UPI00048D9CEF|nr:AarF/UbiB family protein [Legionella fairfieldensis]
MPGKEPILIDVMNLQNNSEHQQIFSHFLKQQLHKEQQLDSETRIKFGKKLNSQGNLVIYNQNTAQPFSLSHSILVFPKYNGYALQILSKNSDKNYNFDEKRKRYDKSSNGSIIRTKELYWDGTEIQFSYNTRVIKKIRFRHDSLVDKKNFFAAQKAHAEKEIRLMQRIPSLDYQSSVITKKAAYINMAKIPGKTLKTLLLTDQYGHQVLDIWERFEITINMLEKLNEIHQQGMIHADIHDENIIIDLDRNLAHLIDFGFAQEIASGKKKADTAFLNDTYDNDVKNMLGLLTRLWNLSDFVKLPDEEKNDIKAALSKATMKNAEHEELSAIETLHAFKKIYDNWLKNQHPPLDLHSLRDNKIMERRKHTRQLFLDSINFDNYIDIFREKAAEMNKKNNNPLYAQAAKEATILCEKLVAEKVTFLQVEHTSQAKKAFKAQCLIAINEATTLHKHDDWHAVIKEFLLRMLSFLTCGLSETKLGLFTKPNPVKPLNELEMTIKNQIR